MAQSGGPDETRRFEGPGGAGGPEATRRMDGPDSGGVPASQVLGDRYRLEELLGAGGMADVHRAMDLRLNRPVAVKIFRPGTDSDGERRFHEEAQLLGNLSHPGLVAVYDSGVEGHRAYLVTELVDGWSLRETLDQQRLSLEEVVRIGTELADVLAYVHEQGVVHRDVKPSNVLLGRDGRVRLADFGISRLVGASGLTADDATLGTASYLAPEQVQGDRVGPPADVYALGLVLLEAVTGRVEYPGGGWETAAERLSRPPMVPDDLPVRLRRALRFMTETDPTGRPTAAQAAAMLGRGRATDGAAVEEPPRRSRATRNVAIALGIVAVIAVLGALLYASADDERGVAQPSATEEPADDPAAEDTAADDPAAEDEDSSGEDPAAEDPAGEGLGGEGSGSEDGPGFPELPNFDAPDLPDAPEMPESGSDDAANAWERFKAWVSSWF
ncbi:MAG: protein kinase [Pseudonocardiaceae bacterium]|nr:protein kinase [Pseudonocardiaceae bacterium]